jgi:predicted RNase H-like HicB family nuclease
MQVLVNLIYDPEYEGYVAHVPELPGCMSQGRTAEEALQNVRRAIELYLEASPEERRPSAKPPLTTVLEI